MTTRLLKQKLTTPSKLTKSALTVVLLLPFALLALRLATIHPNENVYFNVLTNGLKGAKEKDLPAWGNTFGAAYRDGVAWINDNAAQGSKVVLTYELLPNIPKTFFRTDLTYQNSYRSGYLQQGEYAITLLYQGTESRSYYDIFLNKYLNPVYESTVDGVPILRVWKNDQANMKEQLLDVPITDFKVSVLENEINIDLHQQVQLSRMEISFHETNCKPLTSATVYTSSDYIKWSPMPGDLPRSWLIPVLGPQPKDGNFIEPFVGQYARAIKITVSPSDTCLKKVKNVKVYSHLFDPVQALFNGNFWKVFEEKFKNYTNGRVLDMACGTGELRRHITPKEYVDIDINPSYIDYNNANIKTTKTKFLLMDASKNLPAQKFDTVFLISALHQEAIYSNIMVARC